MFTALQHEKEQATACITVPQKHLEWTPQFPAAMLEDKDYQNTSIYSE